MSFAFNCVHRRAIDRHVGSGALVAKAPPPAPPPRHPHPPPFPPSPLFLLLLSFYILRFTFAVYLFRSPVNARDIRRHECKIYLCTICTSPIRGSDSHLYLIFPVHRRWQSLFLLLFFSIELSPNENFTSWIFEKKEDEGRRRKTECIFEHVPEETRARFNFMRYIACYYKMVNDIILFSFFFYFATTWRNVTPDKGAIALFANFLSRSTLFKSSISVSVFVASPFLPSLGFSFIHNRHCVIWKSNRESLNDPRAKLRSRGDITRERNLLCYRNFDYHRC